MSKTGNYLGDSLGFALLRVLAVVVYCSRMHGTSGSLAGAVADSQHCCPGRPCSAPCGSQQGNPG